MINEICALIPILDKLNLNQVKNSDKYKVLKTKENKCDNFQNNLTINDRIEIGSIAINFHKMSPNYRWNIKSDFYNLKPSQKMIINYVLKQKDKNYSMFPLVEILSK